MAPHRRGLSLPCEWLATSRTRERVALRINSRLTKDYMNALKKEWRTLALSVSLAVAGAVGGTLLAGTAAQAQGSQIIAAGYTCYQTDLCHEGSASCCTDDFGGGGHCTTMCSP